MKNKKTILITGAAGFVGHHCIDHLLKNTDWKIIILDSLNYAGNMNRVTDSDFFTPERVKFIWHDLRAPISESVHKMIGELDYCIHFAAESHVDRSLEDSIPFVMSNVVGTANLLEYFKHYQPECKTLIFSTDEVFGPAPEGVYFKENDSFRPSNPYCLLPDTKIITKNGPISIKEFDIEKEKVISKFKEIGKRVGEDKASKKFQFDFNGEILEIRTDCGEINVTPEHKFFRITSMKKKLEKPRFYDNKGNPVIHFGYRKIMEVPAKQLKKGDYILSLRYVPLNFRAVKGNKRLIRFLGYFLGDGSYSIKSRYVKLADENIDFLVYYRDILKDYLGASPKSSTGQFGTIYKHGTKNCYYLQFASEKLRKEINLKDLKEVVSKAFNLRKESLAEFLAGFFDAESWFNYEGKQLQGISIFQSHRPILDSIQFLLRRLGIVSKIRRDRKGWKLYITDNLSLQFVVKKIPSLKIKKETIFRKRQHKNWNNYFYWSEIKEIKKSNHKGKVYDLEIPAKHNYVANYFIVHNSASKAGEEMIAYSFAHAFNLPISIVRSMNIIGERQHPEKFLPKTIKAILNNEKVILHGKGREDLSSRCWIHARNVADGLLFLLDKAEKEESYHIVGEERTVLEMADWICEVIKERKLKNEEINWVDYHQARPGHDKRYALSGEKLAKMGWEPSKNLEESLKKAVRWMIDPKHKKWLNL